LHHASPSADRYLRANAIVTKLASERLHSLRQIELCPLRCELVIERERTRTHVAPEPRHRGFRACTSGLWVNAGCPDRLTSDIEKWIERQEPQHDQPLVLIGHSRGGLLARALAVRLGRRVSHLITLGSPVGLVSAFAQHGNVPQIAHPTMSTVCDSSIRPVTSALIRNLNAG
jgi:pimeloyl-ACP methyl ester carboxylesterase